MASLFVSGEEMQRRHLIGSPNKNHNNNNNKSKGVRYKDTFTIALLPFLGDVELHIVQLVRYFRHLGLLGILPNLAVCEKSRELVSRCWGGQHRTSKVWLQLSRAAQIGPFLGSSMNVADDILLLPKWLLLLLRLAREPEVCICLYLSVATKRPTDSRNFFDASKFGEILNMFLKMQPHLITMAINSRH